MTFNELLPSWHAFLRADKLQLIYILAADVACSDCVAPADTGTTYAVWSPCEAFDFLLPAQCGRRTASTFRDKGVQTPMAKGELLLSVLWRFERLQAVIKHVPNRVQPKLSLQDAPPCRSNGLYVEMVGILLTTPPLRARGRID